MAVSLVLPNQLNNLLPVYLDAYLYTATDEVLLFFLIRPDNCVQV